MFNFLQTLVSNYIPQNFSILFEISLIIILATAMGLIIRLIKQPLIPAYIITGILIGPLVFGVVKNQELINALSEIGVAFLIFTAGLEIKFNRLKEVGKVVSIGGIFQVLILFIIGVIVCLFFGIWSYPAIYVGLVVAFSSTMVVVKLLADKRELNSLHGRIIIGILLIQDIIAIIALVVLSSDLTIFGILLVILKAGIFAVLAMFLSKNMNPIFEISAKNHELLLLVSISFLFLFSTGAYFAGLSLIIGAFFAGVSLANSDYKTEIEGKISSLREFFSVIFFVSLGMQLRLISKEFFILFLVLLVLVIVLKPVITMILIRILGYKKRTSFLTGNALAQTSEFSFIIATLGLSLGHIDQGLFSTLVLLTIFTMSSTIYFMNSDKKLSKYLDWPLNLFNRFETHRENLEYHEEDGKKTIIIGCHRMGSLFLKEFENEKKSIFVIDYNPDIIKPLIKKKIPCIYGDFTNQEVFDKANLRKAETIIITVPNIEDNILFIKKVRRINNKVSIFIVAERISEAISLYKAGADYVILPQVIGGQKVSELIKKTKSNKSDLEKMKKDHLKYLDSVHHILY